MPLLSPRLRSNTEFSGEAPSRRPRPLQLIVVRPFSPRITRGQNPPADRDRRTRAREDRIGGVGAALAAPGKGCDADPGGAALAARASDVTTPRPRAWLRRPPGMLLSCTSVRSTRHRLAVQSVQHPVKLRAATEDAASPGGARMRAAGRRATFAARQLQPIVLLRSFACRHPSPGLTALR